MLKKQFLHLLPICVFFALLFTGCAHKPAGPLNEAPQDAAIDQTSTTTLDKTEDIGSTEDAANKIENDFFEEEFETHRVRVADPLYIWNKLYFWVLKPLAKGYKAITPEFFRTGVSNLFYNLMMPIRFVNCILQGKGHAAASEFSRFVINTTIGVLGVWDPASRDPELNPPDDEDLGQTLGKYGIGNGFFLVWPILGPTTLRDFVGWVGDSYLNPIYYVGTAEVSLAIDGIKIINRTSFHIGEYEALKKASVDPYVAMRNSYLQYREKKIRQ
jgi:phospholipid-binding lipoprotein MlaA